MKKDNLLILFILVAAVVFTGCEKDKELVPNAKYISTDTTGIVGGSGGGNGGGLPSDFMAPTVAMNRAALLENFTAVRCGLCADGHDKAKAIKLALGANKFIILAVHGGSDAAAQPGYMDFTTPFGQALITQAQVSDYPAGTISRIQADSLRRSPQKPNGYAMGRGEWNDAAQAVLAMTAPLNIGAKATLTGMDLKVDVDIYYTEEETMTNNINVALVQDGITSKQSGGSPSVGYLQNNVLRDLITGQWGDPITVTTKAKDFVRKTYNYTIPNDYNGSGADGGGPIVLTNLKVVVFVTRGQTQVLNVIEKDI